MTLISEYAGVSRATVHKYARNKEDAFRKVCKQFQVQAQEACTPFEELDLECWQAIDLILQIWLKPTFDEVSESRVLNDLKYHIQHIAQDIFKEARQILEDMINKQITKGIAKQQISLEQLGYTSQTLTQLILASLDGLRGHYEKQDLNQASQNMLTVFKVACKVN
ncbi:hypothetical protein NBRC116188_11270 [Oceaniserpentilla sp. 4NH20-0058]